jgi:nucleoside-diphosphate-sugar epimerase
LEILISGGNGFLGRHLIGELQKRGDHIRVLALDAEDTSWVEEHNVAVYRGDILDPDTLSAPLRGVQSVFHLAAMMGVWRSMRDYCATNVLGTENVCRAALKAGVSRVIHTSSAMVYNMASGRPATEQDPLTPLSEPYSVSKARGDLLVQAMIREEGLPAVILRPGTLIGPGDRLNFGRMADRVGAGRAIIIGQGKNAIPLVDVTDMVRGLVLALDSEHAVGETYNIGNDQPLNQAEYLSLIAQELGTAGPRLHVPYAALYSAAYCAERLSVLSHNRIRPFLTRHGVKLYGANNLLSIDKARRELGYEPMVSAGDAVRRASRWYRDQARDVAKVDELETPR